MNNSKVKFLGGIVPYLVVVLFATGCVSVPMAPSEKDKEAKLFEADPDNAIVYLFRKSSSYGMTITFPITLDGREVGKTKSGSFFMFRLPPGEHDIWVTGGDSIESLNTKYKFTVMANPGEIYFIEQSSSTARSPRLDFVSKIDGKNAVLNCDLLAEEKIQGPSVFQ